MSELGPQLERESARAELAPGARERFEHRLRWRQRRRRVGAFIVALSVGILGVASAMIALSGRTPHSAGTNPSDTTPAPGSAAMSPAFVGLDGAALSGVNLAPDAWEPNLSPDGQWIVYVTRSTDVGSCGGCADAPRLAVVRVDGTGSHFLDLHGVSIDDVSQPVWSPDGTMIAFVQGDGAYYSGNIAVIDTGGTRSSGSSLGGVDRVHVIHLTSGPTQKSWPSWSPDGSSIIYNDSGSTPLDDSGFSATQEIYSVAADGTGSPVRITHNQVDDSEAVYSPDGSKMALFHGGGVVIMNADGSNIRPTKSGGGFSPRWSPDGSKIAFFTYSDVERYILPNPRTGRPYSWPRLDIKILTIATGGIANVGVSVASDLNAVSWASDGQSLFVNRASNPSG